jgi:hypothetical protein
MTMNEKHVAICEKHIKFWHQLKVSKSISHMSVAVAAELVTVLEEHLRSREAICKWCPESQAYLVKQVYQAYERDAPNPKDITVKTQIEYPNGSRAKLTDNEPAQSVPKSSILQSDAPESDTLPTSAQGSQGKYTFANGSHIEFDQRVDKIKQAPDGTLHVDSSMTGKKLKKVKNNRNNGK